MLGTILIVILEAHHVGQAPMHWICEKRDAGGCGDSPFAPWRGVGLLCADRRSKVGVGGSSRVV